MAPPCPKGDLFGDCLGRDNQNSTGSAASHGDIGSVGGRWEDSTVPKTKKTAVLRKNAAKLGSKVDCAVCDW